VTNARNQSDIIAIRRDALAAKDVIKRREVNDKPGRKTVEHLMGVTGAAPKIINILLKDNTLMY
jgi:hypothetical protein